MCDYSLHHVASRPARVGDKLVSTSFLNSSTRGFAAVGEPNVAVCLLPGTELAFEDLQCEAAYGFGFKRLSHKVARFRQVDKDQPSVHHDALELPDGQIVADEIARRAARNRPSNAGDPAGTHSRGRAERLGQGLAVDMASSPSCRS